MASDATSWWSGFGPGREVAMLERMVARKWLERLMALGRCLGWSFGRISRARVVSWMIESLVVVSLAEVAAEAMVWICSGSGRDDWMR